MNSACIISLMKYEHDFINQWLEYHIKIGFSHFYLIIDNFFEKQPDYIIPNEFIDYVTLINLDRKVVEDMYESDGSRICEQYLNASESVNISGYLHQMINKLIIDKNLIKEDWTTTIGLDQFIYLDHNNLQLSLQSIEDDCTQIIIPWSLCLFNNTCKSYDNLMNNFSLYEVNYGWGGHSNGIIRTKYLKSIGGDSHSFISKNEQKVYIINEYFKLENHLDTGQIFNIVYNKLNDSSIKLNFTSFHFLLRNTAELIIKNTFFGWNKFLTISQIIDAINNKDTHLLFRSNRTHSGREGIKDIIKKIGFNYEFNIPILHYKNIDKYNIDIILHKLKENGFTIEREDLIIFINSLVLY